MFKNEFGQVRSGWLIALASMLVLIGQEIFTVAGLMLEPAISVSSGQPEISLDPGKMNPLVLVLTQGAATLGGLVATLFAFRTIAKKPLRQLRIGGPVPDMVYGLLLGAAAMTVIFFLLAATNQITLIQPLSNPQFSYYTLAFAVIFILTGFFEEIFFRGYVMQTMMERHNQRWLIYLVSAVVFGAAHLLNPNVGVIGVINIILVGFLFAYMFETTKNLMLPIGFHMTWNFFQGPVYGFAVSGLPPHSLYPVDIRGGNDLITGGDFGIEGGLMATLLIVIMFFFTSVYTKNRRTQEGTLFSD